MLTLVAEGLANTGSRLSRCSAKPRSRATSTSSPRSRRQPPRPSRHLCLSAGACRDGVGLGRRDGKVRRPPEGYGRTAKNVPLTRTPLSRRSIIIGRTFGRSEKPRPRGRIRARLARQLPTDSALVHGSQAVRRNTLDGRSHSPIAARRHRDAIGRRPPSSARKRRSDRDRLGISRSARSHATTSTPRLPPNAGTVANQSLT